MSISVAAEDASGGVSGGDAKALRILELVDCLQTRKANLDTFFQEVRDYILPDRADSIRRAAVGQRRNVDLYDSTAVESAEILAGNFAATLTPQGSKWFDLTLGDDRLDTAGSEIREWLEHARDVMLRAFGKSNFYLAMDEVYLDLVGMCTAAIITQMANNKLVFTAWPVRDYVFTIGADGRPDGVYRDYELTVAQVVELLGQHPGLMTLGKTVNDARKPEARPQERERRIRVVHAIYPRMEYSPGKSGPKNMPWASCYVSRTDRVVMAEGGFEEAPVNVARFRVAANDDDGWGRGPGHTIMPDVRTINAMRRMMLRAAAKDIDPPLVIENKGVIGSVRVVPNGITYVRRDARFEYLESGRRMDLAMFDIEKLEQKIRSGFYADHLRLPPPQIQPMTATEFQLRWEMMERLLGPTLGRMQVELLNPIIERVFGLLLRAGAIDQPPQQVLELDPDIDIEYAGPLARSQHLPELLAIERTYQTAANIAQLTGNPAVLDLLDNDAAVRRAASLNGTPTSVMRSGDEIAQVREQRAQQQAELTVKQDAVLAADVTNKVAKAAPEAVA